MIQKKKKKIPGSIHVHHANNNDIGYGRSRRLCRTRAWPDEFQSEIILHQGAVSSPWPYISQVWWTANNMARSYSLAALDLQTRPTEEIDTVDGRLGKFEIGKTQRLDCLTSNLYIHVAMSKNSRLANSRVATSQRSKIHSKRLSSISMVPPSLCQILKHARQASVSSSSPSSFNE